MSSKPQKAEERLSARGLSARHLKALSNPLRHRIQIVLDEREASPTEIAEILSENFFKVCYHVRKLHEAKCIELVGTDNRKGGTQHIYRSIVRPIFDTPEAEEMSQALREAGSAEIVPLVFDDLMASIQAGVFDSRPSRSLLRMGMVVDEQGFDETGEAAMAYLDALLNIQRRSVARLSTKGEQGFNAITATLVFPKAERRAGSNSSKKAHGVN